ncbi:MAG: DNA repair protein RecO [Chloroflexi bacterium]|nr:DNA repair protein RecO [Chloroflexota bacterium]MDA1147768.1 DNA repair protein RecO [Chloroflexota bacterium]MQC83085.1 DNA repair protein RecO [Chloroflexota bacterium]
MPSRIPRVTKTTAIILKHRRLGDADRIITLLTPHRGKIDVVAKGLLRSRSKMAGHLEPLTLSEIVLAHGRSLDIVTQAQTVEPFLVLHRDLEQLSTAMYLLELADRFTVEHEDALEVYELLEASLRRLARGDGVQLVTRRYELGLLTATGFRPELENCLETGAPVDANDAYWTHRGGGVVSRAALTKHPEAIALDPRVLRVLRAFQALPYEEAGRIRIDPDLAGRLEQVMHEFVRAQAERELKSASFVSESRRVVSAMLPEVPAVPASSELAD